MKKIIKNKQKKYRATATNPELHTIFNSHPKKIRIINKNSDAGSSNNSSITKSQDKNWNEKNPKSKIYINGFRHLHTLRNWIKTLFLLLSKISTKI